MYNLMISEIFATKKTLPSNKIGQIGHEAPSLESSIDMNELENYNGLYDADSQSLYQSVRNLYSLSLRQHIKILITNITNYKQYLRSKPS